MHLVKNRKLTLLTFSLMKNFDNVEHNNHIQYDKFYKVTVFYNLNKAHFPPFSFYTFSKSRSLVSMSLPFATVYNTVCNISLSLNDLSNSTN